MNLLRLASFPGLCAIFQVFLSISLIGCARAQSHPASPGSPKIAPIASFAPAGASYAEAYASFGAAYASSHTVLAPLDYQGVTLDGGRMLNQLNEVKAYYLAIPNDNLLRGFRLRAGFPAPGANMGGWYSSDVFHVFGQIISGLSRMYAATGDPACREKVLLLLTEWAKCIEPNGYFFYSRNPNAPHYIYDKMVGGLLDAHLYAAIPEALQYLDRITAWAEANLDRNNLDVGKGPIEWYTLSENLYRAYLVTGNARYRDFGKVWEYTRYWDTFANKGNIFSLTPWFHAYSHVNTLSGAAMAYQITGEPRYLNTIRNAHDFIRHTQCWATGGYGPMELLLLPSQTANSSIDILDLWSSHFETQCGSWAIFKLCKYLISTTGEARYGDWIEQTLWNGIGASIPMSASGETQYYSHYHLGGAAKRNNMGPWTCCTGTRPQAVADYADLIYFTNPSGLFVNLFTDSSVAWSHGGSTVKVVQRTSFPEDPKTSFSIALQQPSSFTLSMRMPEWLAGPMAARINGGMPTPAMPGARGWAAFSRVWANGDQLEITLPMGFYLRPFPPESAKPFPTAIAYGPVVMALKAGAQNPQSSVHFDNLNASFTPVPGQPLQFRLAAHPSVLAKPYYAFAAGEKYYMYFDPAYKWIHVDHPAMAYSPGWQSNVDLHFINRIGAWTEYAFEGTRARLRYQKFDDASYAAIYLDGNLLAEIDLYNASRGVRAEYLLPNLPPGRHTVRMVALAKRNSSSKNGFINVAGFDYIPLRVNGAQQDTWRSLR